MREKLAAFGLLVAALILGGCMSTSFSGDYVLSAGQTLQGDLFVTSGSVTLQDNSRVTGTIVLTSGELHIGKNAQVGGDVVLTSGALYLDDGAVVHGNVVLSSQDIDVHQAAGARVGGSINHDIFSFVRGVAVRTALLFCVLPLAILIAVLLGLGIWLGRVSKQRPQVAAASVPEGPQQKLQKLKSMLDGGLITEAEYQAKKTDILSKM